MKVIKDWFKAKDKCKVCGSKEIWYSHNQKKKICIDCDQKELLRGL